MSISKAIVELSEQEVIDCIIHSFARRGVILENVKIHVKTEYEDRPCGGSGPAFDKVTGEIDTKHFSIDKRG